MDLKLAALQAFNMVCVGMSVLFFTGLYTGTNVYFTQANLVVKCLIALWLIHRFYRTHKIEFTQFDRIACFTAGTYILLGSMADVVNLYNSMG